jgi:hypothetical protein
MNLIQVKKSLENWHDTSSYDVVKQYMTQHDTNEEFVKHYLGKELYERLETMTLFVKQVESIKRYLS